LTDAWSARARGLVTPWAARVDHVSAFVAVHGGVRLLQRISWRASPAAHYSDDSSFFGCFPVLDCRLYLIVLLCVRFSLVFDGL